MSGFTFELDLPPGLNSDDTTFSAKGHYSDGKNVRFRDGKPEPIHGLIELHDQITPGTPRNTFGFMRSGTATMAYGTASRLLVGTGLAVPSNRSPVGLGSTIAAWSFGAWGNTLLAAPQDGTLYEQSGSSTATEVTQAPDRITCMLIHRRIVMAFGANEEISGTYNALCVRWSDIENYTSWSSLPTNNAGEHILDGAGGAVAIREIGPYVNLWSSAALYEAQFTGDPGATFHFEKVADIGAIGPNAVCVTSAGVAYWVAPDLRLYRRVIGGLPEAVPCPIWWDFVTGLVPGQRSKIIVSTVDPWGEVWIFYARSGNTENSHYLAFCERESVAYQRPVWFKGDLARAAFLDGGVLGGVMAALGVEGQSIGITSAGEMMLHEQHSNLARDWFIQSADQYIESGKRRVMVRDIVPDFEDQAGNVSLTIALRARPHSTAVEKGPYTLTVAVADYQVGIAPTSGATTFTAWMIATGGGVASGRQFTFAGVNEWANGADTGSLARFTLTADHPGGNGVWSFTPAIVDSGAGRNVVNLPVNLAAITLLGNATKRSLRASGQLISVKFAGSGTPVASFARLGKPTFDCVTMGER